MECGLWEGFKSPLLFWTLMWYFWRFGRDHKLLYTGYTNLAAPYNNSLHSKASVWEHLKLLKSFHKCCPYSLINLLINAFKVKTKWIRESKGMRPPGEVNSKRVTLNATIKNKTSWQLAVKSQVVVELIVYQTHICSAYIILKEGYRNWPVLRHVTPINHLLDLQLVSAEGCLCLLRAVYIVVFAEGCDRKSK